MRFFGNLRDAVREIERDLFEMGQDVHPATMQDKFVADDDDYATKEVFGYAVCFDRCLPHPDNREAELFDVVRYLDPAKDEAKAKATMAYIKQEFEDRLSTDYENLNPGKSWKLRDHVWSQFNHGGKFAYTYAERFAPQLRGIIRELNERPDTRQAVMTIHSGIASETMGLVGPSVDHFGMGGKHRIPCSLNYQFMRRFGKLDMIYSMRSCDFLTHFIVDIILALLMQEYIASQMVSSTPVVPGKLVYMAGSLHAYKKDLKVRGIF